MHRHGMNFGWGWVQRRCLCGASSFRSGQGRGGTRPYPGADFSVRPAGSGPLRSRGSAARVPALPGAALVGRSVPCAPGAEGCGCREWGVGSLFANSLFTITHPPLAARRVTGVVRF